MRLAFIVALQHLPAKQRAVLILRDVLARPAADVANLLDTSAAAVNSALQRARAQVAALGPHANEVSEPADERQREYLDRYVTAFVNSDMTELTSILREDVELEMPPSPTWFAGREDVVAFFGARVSVRPDRFRLLPAEANGQPTLASYIVNDAGVHQAHAILVFTVTNSGISRIVAFTDTTLFPAFDLPPSLTG